MDEEGWEKSLIHCLYFFLKIESMQRGRWRVAERICLSSSGLPRQISIDLPFLLRRVILVRKIAHDKFSKSSNVWTRPALASLPLCIPGSYQDKAEPGPGRRARVQKFSSPVEPRVALKGMWQQWYPAVNSQCAPHLCWEQAQRGNRTESLLLRFPRMRSSLVLSRFFCTNRTDFSKIPHPNPILPRTLSG